MSAVTCPRGADTTHESDFYGEREAQQRTSFALPNRPKRGDSGVARKLAHLSKPDCRGLRPVSPKLEMEA
ncbi:hypothetical protein [Spirosoma areae]